MNNDRVENKTTRQHSIDSNTKEQEIIATLPAYFYPPPDPVRNLPLPILDVIVASFQGRNLARKWSRQIKTK